jgi:hypothetical protein
VAQLQAVLRAGLRSVKGHIYVALDRQFIDFLVVGA